jgi:hypothetical protein
MNRTTMITPFLFLALAACDTRTEVKAESLASPAAAESAALTSPVSGLAGGPVSAGQVQQAEEAEKEDGAVRAENEALRGRIAALEKENSGLKAARKAATAIVRVELSPEERQRIQKLEADVRGLEAEERQLMKDIVEIESRIR